jgi:hypothetical protein
MRVAICVAFLQDSCASTRSLFEKPRNLTIQEQIEQVYQQYYASVYRHLHYHLAQKPSSSAQIANGSTVESLRNCMLRSGKPGAPQSGATQASEGTALITGLVSNCYIDGDVDGMALRLSGEDSGNVLMRVCSRGITGYR